MSLAVLTDGGASRRGFTLLELLLVLALLVLVAAAAWPSLDAWFQTYRLQEASDSLRTHWVKARIMAMDEGRPYRFAWQSGAGYFRLAPDDFESWPELAGASTGPRISGAGYPPGLYVESTLPDGVVFMEGDIPLTLLFWPDGTARIYAPDGSELPELQLLLVDRRGHARLLQVRSVTGGVTVTPLGRI